MSLPVDVSKVTFVAGNDPNPVVVFETQQQKQKEGQPVFDVQIVAFPEVGEAEVLKIRILGAPQGLKRHQPVKVTGLEIRPWQMGTTKSYTYWATAIEPAAPSRAS